MTPIPILPSTETKGFPIDHRRRLLASSITPGSAEETQGLDSSTISAVLIPFSNSLMKYVYFT